MFYQTMSNFLKNWKNRRELKRSGVRVALADDIDFVLEQTIVGAENGHYAQHLLESEHQARYRTMLSALINGQGTVTRGERGDERKNGRLWIYTNDSLGNIGYFSASEKSEGSGENEIELLMAGIKSEHQGKGHGTKMINMFLSLCSAETTLYARCYPASKTMYSLLLNIGFKKINTKPGGTRELELKKT